MGIAKHERCNFIFLEKMKTMPKTCPFTVVVDGLRTILAFIVSSSDKKFIIKFLDYCRQNYSHIAYSVCDADSRFS